MTTSAARFEAWMQRELQRVEEALSAWVPADAPAGLGEAMRYAVLGGGKRLLLRWRTGGEQLDKQQREPI